MVPFGIAHSLPKPIVVEPKPIVVEMNPLRILALQYQQTSRFVGGIATVLHHRAPVGRTCIDGVQCVLALAFSTAVD